MNFQKLFLFLIVAVISFHAVINSYILYQSRIIRAHDEEGYITESLELNKKITNKDYGCKDMLAGFSGEYASRGFIHYVQCLILIFLDKLRLKDIDSMILITNLFFFSILLIATYGIGALLYNERVGFLAAILLSFSPQVFNDSRLNMPDLPLAAMVSLSFLCLLRTKHFHSIVFSVFTAMVFILAEFTKETAIIFILPVTLFYFLESLRIREKRERRIANFSIIILVLLARLITVYLFNNQFLLRYGLWKIFYRTNDFDFFYYIKSIPLHYLGLIFSIISIPILLSYAYSIKKRNKFLFFWLFIPFLVFCISPNRVSRFLLPVLPSLFLLLTAELFEIPFRFRKICAVALTASVIFQYVTFNFFPNLLVSYPKLERSLLSARKDEDFYKIEKLIDIFMQEQSHSKVKNKIIFTSYHI